MERPNASGKVRHKLVDDLSGAVGGTVVHRNHQHFGFGVLHLHQGIENIGDDFLLVVSSYEHGNGRPVGGVNVNVGMPLEAEEAVQREPVVARGIDADDEDNCVENVESWRATTTQTQVLRGHSFPAAALRALSSASLFRRRGCGLGGSLNCLSASNNGVFFRCQRATASTIRSEL